MYRVILVDDEPWALSGLEEIIPWNEYGFEVCGSCANAKDALSLFGRSGADVIFTDLRMPVMSGIDLIAEIKKIKKETQCIIVSAYSDFEVARRAIEYQVSGYILKPLAEKEVLKIVQKVKLILDAGGEYKISVNPAESASLEQANKKIAEKLTLPWRIVLLGVSDVLSKEYRGLMATDKNESTLVEIKNSPMAGLIFGFPEKTPFCIDKNSASSLWHKSPVDIGILLREASAAGCGNFCYADHGVATAVPFYIGEHYTDNFSLEDLGSKFFIPKSYMGEFFKRYSGDTVVNFTQKVRLYNSCRMLEYSELPIKQIAEETGFNNLNYYYNSFKGYLNVTPKQFRDQYIGHSSHFRPDFYLPVGPKTSETAALDQN
jgi:two-component system response regulator YesN